MPSKLPTQIKTESESESESESDSSTAGEEEEEEEAQDTPEHESQKVVKTPLKFSAKKPNSNSKQPQSSVVAPGSDSSDESDSADSGSDSDSPAQNQNQNHALALHVKPISSKPMLQSPETPSGASSGSVKRRLETEGKESRKDQKKKKKVSDIEAQEADSKKKTGEKKVSDVGGEEDSEKKTGEDSKKMFQRLWTDEDEIVILKGMASFRKKGKDASSHVTEFFDYIKHVLRPDVNKVQLQSKIRSIRRKYLNALKKVKTPGTDPLFTKPHDKKVYHLSKKVWSPQEDKDDGEHKPTVLMAEVVEEDGEKSNTKSKPVNEGTVNEGTAASSAKPKATTLPDNSHLVNEKQDSENICEYAFLNASLLPRDLPIPAPGLGEFFQKKGWNLIGSSTAASFNKQWKAVIIAETKAYLQRIDLVREQTKAMLDALESTDL